MTPLMTASAKTLSFLSRQMKEWILEFGTGASDVNAPYGRSTLEIAIGTLRAVQRSASARGIDTTGSEWGPNVEGIISASGLDRPQWRG